MRVLIVHPHMTVYGGAETVVHRMSQVLSEKKVANSVLTLSLSPEVKKFCEGVDFILPEKNYEYKVRSTGILAAAGLINEIKGLNALIRRSAKDYDIINVHNFPTTWAACGAGRPVVWMCNEPPELWNNPNPSLALRSMYYAGAKADRLIVDRIVRRICVADSFNRDRIWKKYAVDAEVIPYGIESALFREGDGPKARLKYGLGASFVVLQAGMITPQKNQMETLKAVKKLKNSIKNIRLVLAGMGGTSYEAQIRRYIAENSLEKSVVFTGHIGKDELKDLYHACDVAVFPVKTQGGWLAPFEVLSAGRPVVVSNMMGAAGLMKEHDLAIVTDRFEVVINDVYRQRERHFKNAERSRRWVSQNLTWRRFTERMLNVFESVN